MMLVPAFMASLLYWQEGQSYFRTIALMIFVVACFTDAADGFIARRTRQQTRLGSLIDPLADKLLLVTAFLALTIMGGIPDGSKLPAWLTVLVVSRDVFLITGMIIIFVMSNQFDAKTNFLGKNAFLTIF